MAWLWLAPPAPGRDPLPTFADGPWEAYEADQRARIEPGRADD